MSHDEPPITHSSWHIRLAGVSPVRGTRDPRRGRLVLTGWFSEPTPTFRGSLATEEAAASEAMRPALEAIQQALASDVSRVIGFLAVCMCIPRRVSYSYMARPHRTHAHTVERMHLLCPHVTRHIPHAARHMRRATCPEHTPRHMLLQAQVRLRVGLNGRVDAVDAICDTLVADPADYQGPIGEVPPASYT